MPAVSHERAFDNRRSVTPPTNAVGTDTCSLDQRDAPASTKSTEETRTTYSESVRATSRPLMRMTPGPMRPPSPTRPRSLMPSETSRPGTALPSGTTRLL